MAADILPRWRCLRTESRARYCPAADQSTTTGVYPSDTTSKRKVLRDMIALAVVRFRRLRAPFPYTLDNGQSGTSYSFEAIDQDDTKCTIKCTEDQYHTLANVKRDDMLEVTIDTGTAKVRVFDEPNALKLPVPAK